MHLKRIMLALMAVIFILPNSSYAGSFGVVPIRVTLDSNKKTESLKITNQSTEKVTLQVKAMEWFQDGRGNDDYRDTDDLVYFPRVFSLEGKEERMVKLGFKGIPSNKEKSYRIFIEEIPDTEKRTNEQALRIILKMSIPVFINPAAETAGKGEIADMLLSERSFSMKLKNTGNAHFLIKAVRVTGQDTAGNPVAFPDKKGWYLLEGASRSYAFDMTKEKCLNLKELNIEIETENFTLKEKHRVDKKMCEG